MIAARISQMATKVNGQRLPMAKRMGGLETLDLSPVIKGQELDLHDKSSMLLKKEPKKPSILLLILVLEQSLNILVL